MYTPADRYTQTIMASTHRPIGSQIGLLETNERTVSDWPCSRMTGNNPCTYVCTFSNVFSCSAVPSVNISQVIIILCYRFRSRSGKVILFLKYMMGRGSNGGGGGGIVAYSQRRIPSTLLTICGLKLRQLSDGYRKSIKMLE